MLSIILCHVCQYFGNEAAWWLNIGVQIFLTLSGFLFGGKAINGGIGRWYWRRFKRIYAPYLILLIAILITDIFVVPDQVSIWVIVTSFTCIDTSNVPNGKHLWYITVILACYLITPYLMWVRDSRKSKTKDVMSILSIIAIWFLLTLFNKQCFWVINYIAGFLLGAIQTYGNGINTGLMKSASLGSTLAIIVIFAAGWQWLGFASGGLVYRALHILAGIWTIAIAQLLKQFFSIDSESLTASVLDLFDKYSYDIYLVHQVLILGSFSIFNNSSIGVVSGITIAFIWSFVAGFLLHQAGETLLSVVSVAESKLAHSSKQ